MKKESKFDLFTIVVLFIFAVLIGLKLFKVIDLSWWWVTAPLWSGCAILIFIFALAISIAFFEASWKALLAIFFKGDDDETDDSS